MNQKTSIGHLLAVLTILIWGTTFISTKILLTDFKPVEILFFRFVLGLIALWIVHPHRLKRTTKKQELTFAAAGLCGICLYYLLENIALTYSMASNISVILSVTPFFTAILSCLVTKGEKLSLSFFVGFVVAMAGIALISFNGSRMQLNPLGDMLAILAGVVWAFYSVFMKDIGNFGYNTIAATRRVFTYGILFMIPALFFFDFDWDLTRFGTAVNLFNIVYLGLGASAMCFVTWNVALKILGVVKTSVYIYAIPVITVIASVIILHEKITLMSAAGTVLTLVGLFLSESKLFSREQRSSK